LLQVHRVAVAVLVVAMIVSQWCSLAEAQLNPVEVAALFDLCDRPGTDLWANCSDSANACTNNWTGIDCNANKTAVINMYADWFASYRSEFAQHSLSVECVSDRDLKSQQEDRFRRRLRIWLSYGSCAAR